MNMSRIRILLLVISFLAITTFVFAGSVSGYYRKDGTYVKPYYRSNPNDTPYRL